MRSRGVSSLSAVFAACAGRLGRRCVVRGPGGDERFEYGGWQQVLGLVPGELVPESKNGIEMVDGGAVVGRCGDLYYGSRKNDRSRDWKTQSKCSAGRRRSTVALLSE